jgi:serine/threonine-protein kinase
VLRRFAKFIVYIAVFMAAAGSGAYFTVHFLIRSENRVVVPDLVNKDVVYALEVLSDLGLNTKIKGTQFHLTVPKHNIIDQSPAPGTEIKRGRDVRLVISKGVQWVVLPNVVGMDPAMADIILQENDLQQKHLSFTHSRRHPKGKILSQHPKAGTKGLRGDTMDMLISSGPPADRLRMMDLKKLSLDEAIELIEKHQLTVGTITQVEDPHLPLEAVAAQSPPQGHPVLSGTAVELTINRPNPKSMDSHRGRDTLFRYRTPPGFLRQKVRVRINRADAAMDIFDDFKKPGEEIWLIIFRDAPTALFLYLDDELMLTQYFD